MPAQASSTPLRTARSTRPRFTPAKPTWKISVSPIMATTSQETADWTAAAMAGVEVKPGVKVAKVVVKGQAGTA